MENNIKDNFRLFFKVNMLFTILLVFTFLGFNEDYAIVSFVLTLFGAMSSVAILYFLYFIILLPLRYFKNFAFYIAGILFILTNIGLVVDYFIFQLYKFHINGMVLDILTSPDAFSSIQIGLMPIVLFIVLVAFFIFFEIFTFRILSSTMEGTKNHINRKINLFVIYPLIFIIFVEKISYGIATLLNKNELTANFSVIPLYQPLTFNRLAAKYFDYKSDVEMDNSVKINGKVNYPVKPLEIDVASAQKFNIVIIASDSASFSVLNQEVTPNIEQFKKDAISFENHFSGGNATRFGIFSLIYGVNSTYWFSFLNSYQSPVLFDILKKLNYQIDIISSTNTNWPEFRKTCYVGIQKSIKDDFKNSSVWMNDLQSTQYFLDKINNFPKKQPLFSFVFLDAPHGYSYPPEANKFQATGENINYLNATKGSSEIANAYARYKNAVYFNDKLFGDMIAILKEKDLYNNSLIIFTSDHGQEFYEYGNFGHNSAFSKAQTQTPFIIKLPKNLENLQVDTKKLTSHNDVVPTILSLLGVQNNTLDYSNGYNLFDKDFKRQYAFVGSWNQNALITEKNTYIFSNTPDKMFRNEVRQNSNYEKIKGQKADTQILVDIINENKRFIK